MAGWGGRV
ncbi:hypothetical protein YPPY95_1856, partial [Yersinia pestis PY-95]